MIWVIKESKHHFFDLSEDFNVYILCEKKSNPDR